MNAPLIWIGLPLLLAALLLFLPRDRWITYLGTFFSLSLAGIAFWLPPDTARRLGSLSLKIDSTFPVLGRQFTLGSSDQVVIILVYGIGAFWFFGTFVSGNARRIIPMGLAISALLIASIAIQPFLYAALLIEIAVLLTIPLLADPTQKAGRGLIRFLIYQSFAMPFILFAGFLLAGVEAGPGDVALVGQAAILLGLGFAFLLSIFPFYSWIPLLAEETHPLAIGFILTIFPTFGLIFALNFIDQYSWMRDSAVLTNILLFAGLIMVVFAGVWAAFQHRQDRIFAFVAVAETGLSLLALSLSDRQVGLQLAFYLIIPRSLAYGVWMLSLHILKTNSAGLDFKDLQGIAHQYPVSSAGVVLANLALAGFPLFANFPIRQAIWENLGSQSTQSALWLGLAGIGLWVSAMRTLAVLTQAPGNTPWVSQETWSQRIQIGIGLVAMLVLGLFPQWMQIFLYNLPALFEHLGK